MRDVRAWSARTQPGAAATADLLASACRRLGGRARLLLLLTGCVVAGLVAVALRPPAAGPPPAAHAAALPVTAMRGHAAPHDLPTPTPTPTATPAQSGQQSSGGGHCCSNRPPSYPVVYRITIPSQGMSMNVVQVGLTQGGAMDAPEGPLGSAFWREAFWLGLTATPGSPGTATVAGHLDDIGGRPAAFWNLRNVGAGTDVYLVRVADNVTFHYRISEANVFTDTQASSQPVLGRLYGSAGGGHDDGVARLSLITCTGHWRGSRLGYDHRFIAFAELVH